MYAERNTQIHLINLKLEFSLYTAQNMISVKIYPVYLLYYISMA